MTATSLRSLAKDHANGVLDRESYRKARDDYLLAVLSGQVTVNVNEYRPLVATQDLDTTFEKTAINAVPPSKPQPAPQPAPQAAPPATVRPTTEFVPPDDLPFEPVADKQSGLPKGLLAGAIIISVLIIVVLAGLMILKPDTDTAGNVSVLTEPLQDTGQVGTATAEEMIVEFLRYNNWSDLSLQQFSAKWNTLDTTAQSQALVTPEMTRLSNAIYQQLVEVRSNNSPGNADETVEKQRVLVEFAALLGISDPRLVVREIVPVETPATPSDAGMAE